ncbi:hypothetical protein ScPMuIL_013295, partial [Solemya velum]
MAHYRNPIADVENRYAQQKAEIDALRQEKDELVHQSMVSRDLQLEMSRKLEALEELNRIPVTSSTPGPYPLTGQSSTTIIERSTVNCVLPEKFTGEGKEDWTDWISLFETHAEINQWTMPEMGKFLVSLLRGRARKVWHEIPLASQGNYGAIKKILTKAFVPFGVGEFRKAELHAIRRKLDESLYVFSLEIRRLVRQAYPELDTVALDILAKDNFVNKVDNSNLRLKLRHMPKLSFDEIVAVAMEWETIEQADKARSSIYASSVGIKSETSTMAEQIQFLCEEMKTLRSEIASVERNLNKTKVHHPFTVVKGIPYSVMLGSDFFEKYRAVVDYGKRSFRFWHDSVPLQIRGQENVVHVKATQTHKIPPRHRQVVWAKLDKDVHIGEEGLIEGNSTWELDNSIVIARVLVRANELGQVPIQVMNPTNDTLTISKKSVLGSFAKVQDREVNIAGKVGHKLPELPEHLNSEQHDQLSGLLTRYSDVYSDGTTTLGCTQVVVYEIDTGNAKPMKLPGRRLPHHKEEIVREKLGEMLNDGTIEPSSSAWSSPIVLATKSDGSLRFCVDYRKLNEVTIKDAYPLPRITEALEQLGHSSWFTSLDMISGYWQVGLDPSSADKTAFTTLVYLDNIVVFSSTFEEHVTHLEEVFARMRRAGLKFKSSKCSMAQRKLLYLGHEISGTGIATDPAKIEAVRNWPDPVSLKDVQKFLGLASYYGRFVKDFSIIANPLTSLTRKDVKFEWSVACQESFKILKERLTSSPILVYPEFSLPFIIDTDASDCGIGGVLSQIRDEKEVVVAYFSKSLSKTERNYSVTRKELLAVIQACEHFKHYLIEKKFKVRSDHGSLRWLTNFKEPQGQVARWIERLAEFDFEIEHRAGRLHNNADALSRHPSCSDVEPEMAQYHAPVVISPQYNVGQDQDPEIKILKKAKETQSSRPEFSSLGVNTRLARELWNQWDVLHIENGVLVRKLENNKVQRVLPNSLRRMVLERLHDANPEGAHLGPKKTQSKVKQLYYWPYGKSYKNTWCQTCTVCVRKRQPRKKDRTPLVVENPGYPFSRIAMDILGPLPMTESGNKYILVVQDYFTKFVETFALPNQEAKTVARKVVDEVFSRYGVPETIHTDQGSNFESQLFSELCENLQITKTRTTPFHPQSDGMVERFNRTLLSMLSCYVSDYGADWDIHLPKILMAYRSSMHHSTGCTPNFAMFKSEISLPVEFLIGPPPDRNLPFQEYVKETWLEYQEAFARIRLNLGTKCVWLAYPRDIRRQCKKFAKPWKGPFKVIQILSSVVYRIRPWINKRLCGKMQVVHANRLKLMVTRDSDRMGGAEITTPTPPRKKKQ